MASSRLCHAHLHVIGLMCNKFHLDDLKSVGGVLDTKFHQQTDYLLPGGILTEPLYNCPSGSTNSLYMVSCFIITWYNLFPVVYNPYNIYIWNVRIYFFASYSVNRLLHSLFCTFWSISSKIMIYILPKTSLVSISFNSFDEGLYEMTHVRSYI